LDRHSIQNITHSSYPFPFGPAFSATFHPLPQRGFLALDILIDKSVIPFQFDVRPLDHAFDEHIGFRVELIDLRLQIVAIIGCVF
jgi:hypothetical protein